MTTFGSPLRIRAHPEIQTAFAGVSDSGMPSSVQAICDPGASRGARATVLRAVDDRTSDESLMDAVAARADRDAFVHLFRRYAGKVKAHLVARSAPASVADELTNEVMLVMWRKAALFDARKGSLATWLYTISRNCLLNHVRRADQNDPGLDVREESDGVATGEQLLIDREARRGLASSLDGLPPEQRDILYRAYWRGQTLQECADETAVPLGTVKTRVRLALARLREKLGARRNDE